MIEKQNMSAMPQPIKTQRCVSETLDILPRLGLQAIVFKCFNLEYSRQLEELFNARNAENGS